MAPCETQMFTRSKCQCCGDPITNSLENEKTLRPESYNILAHVETPRKIVKIKALKPPGKHTVESTYKEAFCHSKQTNEKTKLCYPKSYLPIAEKWIADDTTYESAYKKVSDKKRMQSRGQPVTKSCNIHFPNDKFKGRSETKGEFRNPITRKYILKEVLEYENKACHRNVNEDHETSTEDHPPKIKVIKPKPWQIKKVASSTTYQTFFKKPKPLLQIKQFAPSTTLKCHYSPFRHISQYMDDFKKKRVHQREEPKWNPNLRAYKDPAPDICMENKTSYKSSYPDPRLHKARKWHSSRSPYPSIKSQKKPKSVDNAGGRNESPCNSMAGECGSRSLCRKCLKKLTEAQLSNTISEGEKSKGSSPIRDRQRKNNSAPSKALQKVYFPGYHKAR